MERMSEKKDTVILYHGGCPDGFGSAYAAWEKFGDEAEYIPVRHLRPTPEGLEGRRLFFVDFTYPREIMDTFVKTAQSVTVIDHHLGIKEIVEAMPEHVFDASHSGAVLTWQYFHPDTPVPLLLQYIEDGDLYRFALPDARAILAYVYVQRFEFHAWDQLARDLENESTRRTFIERGAVYNEYHDLLVERAVSHAKLVSFEGYECYLASANSTFASDVGYRLLTQKPPLALIIHMNGNDLHVSLRSDPKGADVSAIARKYGGNGHPQSSSFKLRWGDPLPWTLLDPHENSRN